MIAFAAPSPAHVGLFSCPQFHFWREIDLSWGSDQPDELAIRLGDALLLTAGSGQTGALHIAVLNASNDVTHVCEGVAGDTFPVRFDHPGTFTVQASVDGISAGSLVVHVVYVDFDGPVACQVGYRREKGVAVYGPTDQVFFTAQDPALLEVSVKEQTHYGVRLYLKALGRGTPVVQARLGSATGPILAEQEVDEFILDTSAAQHLVVNGDTDTANTIMTMKPWVPNLDINGAIFASYSTFAGGATAYTLNTSDQTSVDVNGDPAIERVIDPATGETQAVIRLDIEIPAVEDSYCFSASFDQHSKYGTENGWIRVNGSRCIFRMSPIFICEGSTNIYKLPCAASWGNRQLPGHKDIDHAHKMSAVESTKFQLSPRATSWGFNCRTDSQFPDWDPYVKLLSGATAADAPYSVMICGTKFADVITVVKVDIDSVDSNFAPSVENLDVRYTIKPTGYTASFGKIEVFKNGDTVNPIFKDETITMTGANVLYEWDGKANQGADSGKYVGPRDSPYTIKVSISDVADFSSSCSDTKTTKVEVESLAFNINTGGVRVIMNVPEHEVEVSTLVKLKKKDGTGAVTAVPIHVSFSAGDPLVPNPNATPVESYSYATGKYLGKKGDPTAIYWADHASADSGSTDGYKHVCWGATITTAGADQGKTYVWFRPSGVGGDDFILKAAIKDAAGDDLITKASGLLTVWRQADFDNIYEMDGETHVSVNGTEVNIQPYFHSPGSVETFVDYVVGDVKPIPAEKSVQYIGLWKNTPPYQKDWATLLERTPTETPRADDLAAAEGPEGEARDEARWMITQQAQFWVERIDREFLASMTAWEANGGMANKSVVGIKYYHPKYNSVLAGGVPNPDTVTTNWPDWVRVTTYRDAYSGIDPDSHWCPGTGFGGMSHGNKIISIAKQTPNPKKAIAHEVGHATKDFFERRVFGLSLDHSALGLMDPSASQPNFSVDEQKILRGIKP
jgi:hypothetical protein